MSTSAIKVDVTEEDVIGAFSIPDIPNGYPNGPYSLEELLSQAGRKAAERKSGQRIAPPWRHANRSKATEKIEKMAAEGKLLAGPPSSFEVRGRAQKVYATTEVARWYRERKYQEMVTQARAEAARAATAELVRLHNDEWLQLVEDHYLTPAYEIELESSSV